MYLDYETAFPVTLKSATPKLSVKRQSLEDMVSTPEMLSWATHSQM